ncbi:MULTISPECIES: DUF5999 family protein [unclassified Frankia]|uniref:DUF5999 family protein n=1 Tax=unclassified Frankia TaxID=2632575 RepID=UPI001EF60691|nr:MULTISPECIES: DUF5999 family protein [unclassified Frankia]
MRGTTVSGDPSTRTSASSQVPTASHLPGPASCPHSPACPSAASPDRDAARVTIRHYDQGWSLLCNGVILFDDTGEILPTGGTIEPRRGLPSLVSSAAAAVVTRHQTALPTPRSRTA